MRTIQLPELDYPFPSLIHPLVNEIEACSLNWALQFNLLTSEEQVERFTQSRYSWLAARAFPDIGFEEACLEANFITWLFIRDDHTDAANTTVLKAGIKQMLTAMRSAGPGKGEPLVMALHDILQRMRDSSHPVSLQRFQKNLTDYLESTIWETHYRRRRQVPSVKDYIRMRPVAGSMLTVIDTIAIAENICLPDDILQHPVIKRMGLACANLVSWSNDIASFSREMEQSDVQNLVLVIQHNYKIPLEDALREVVSMHSEEMALFLELDMDRPSFGTQNRQVERYITGLRGWIQANFDWTMQDTRRYAMA